jgi:two-component system, NarL family, sensor kinase
VSAAPSAAARFWAAAGAAGPVSRWRSAVVIALASAAWAAALGGVAVAAVAGVAYRVSWPDFTIGLAYPAVAVLVVRVRAASAWSGLMLAAGVFSAVNVAASSWADRAFVAHLAAPGAAWAAWAQSWTWLVSVLASFWALAVFPDGRLPSRRWRAVIAALVLAGALLVAGFAVAPTIQDGYTVANPVPLPKASFPTAGPAGFLVAGLALAGCVGCLAAMAVRFRRGGPVLRRQIGWYAYGNAVTLVLIVLAVTIDVPSLLLILGPVAVAAGAAIGIMRYRLYDIDIIVNRTIAWGVLTALVIGLYVVSVGFFQRVFAGGSTAGALLATGVVAVAFQPLRERIQRSVNQLVYGYRDQPEMVLRELSRSLGSGTPPEGALVSLASTLGRTLRLPAVLLEVDGAPELTAVYGPGARGSLIEAASASNGGTMLRVLAAPRRGSTLTARDRLLLAGIAPSLAATAESLRLQHALDSARVRAVSALAEAQRRMRRELHDGLGPVLAGLRLTIGTARRIAGSDLAAADAMLADAQDDAKSAAEDVRRLAHDLRPPALDDLGLIAALRDRLERLVPQDCLLDLNAVDAPDQLPAAVEVAAYRICCEAVLNVARHARARHCDVTLRADGSTLALTVADDGVGFRPGTAGIGLRSLRERAEELSGAVEIGARAGGGTLVEARLPLADRQGG